jgi:hypothetical protein
MGPLPKTNYFGALVAEFVASSTNADAIGQGVPKTRLWRNVVMQEVLIMMNEQNAVAMMLTSELEGNVALTTNNLLLLIDT